MRVKWFFDKTGAFGGGWVAKVLFGRQRGWIGAGYIGGFTAFIGWNSGSLNYDRSF